MVAPVARKDGKGKLFNIVCIVLVGFLGVWVAILHVENQQLALELATARSISCAQSMAESDAPPTTTTSSIVASVQPALTSGELVNWKIPERLLKARFDECSGGKQITATGGFCLTRKKHQGGNYMYDTNLAEALATLVFKGDSVVDLGAGLGHYGLLLTKNVSQLVAFWKGFDGAMNVADQTDGLVQFMDLTQPGPTDERPCGAQADWVMSLEVAEHIPVVHTDAFLRNVRCRARKGAVISWALPTQRGGLGHVNMRKEVDAIKAVESWGFSFQGDVTKEVRARATIPHFTRTVSVYLVSQPS